MHKADERLSVKAERSKAVADALLHLGRRGSDNLANFFERRSILPLARQDTHRTSWAWRTCLLLLLCLSPRVIST